MEIRVLLNFITVSEVQNIGRAAEKLNITQPALTRQIHMLEEEIGVPLFVRSSNGVELTAGGRALLQHARTIKAELAEAKLAAHEATSNERPDLHIGVYGSAMLSIVPQVLAAYAARNPSVDFRLHNIRKDQQLEQLRSGEVLLVIDRLFPIEQDMDYETVYEENLDVVLRDDHPLAAQEVIDWRAIVPELLVGGGHNDPILGWSLNQITGVDNHQMRHHADDVLTAVALVSAGLGITLAPPSIAALKFPHVVFRPYRGRAKIPFVVQCMFRKNESSPLLQEFLDTVRGFRQATVAVAAQASGSAG